MKKNKIILVLLLFIILTSIVLISINLITTNYSPTIVLPIKTKSTIQDTPWWLVCLIIGTIGWMWYVYKKR